GYVTPWIHDHGPAGRLITYQI
ncbi:MAG: hypothetical protein QOJ66_3148, partial [Ilumatobacteraceae bacterium]